MRMNNESNLENLTKKIVEFRDERDWQQFHNPKDLAISLVLEAAEVMEHFQWKSPDQTKDHIKNNKAEIGEELADTLYWILLLAHDLDIDIIDASLKKLEKNAIKYPVDKAKGKNLKYDKL